MPTTQQRSQPNRTTPTSKTEPQLHTLQKDNSSDVALQIQLDKALADLRDLEAENDRLISENQPQQRSISQLKIAIDEVNKHEQDHSMTQLKNQLHDATSSLIILNKEKKEGQDKLDSMQHTLGATERQIRCLDHLTRHKLESRQEAGYSQPSRRRLSVPRTIPPSMEVIKEMHALNKAIYRTCAKVVDGLERTNNCSMEYKSLAQNVLGDHLTAMMEDQAKKTTTGYNILLMQTVLEVFMTYWCSSIIEAFYPQQESFTDLLIQLSTQTAGK